MAVLFATVIMQGCGRADSANEPLAVAAADPGQAKKLEELHRSADELYREAAEGDYTKARDKLQQISTMMTALSFEGVTSIEGVDQLTQTVVQAKRDFNSVKAQPDHAVKSAAKLKLAADALTHKSQPMWLQYYKVLAEDTRLMAQSLEKKDGRGAAAAFTRMKDHYDTIRPAVWISREPHEGEKIDSLMTFFQGQLQAKEIAYDKVNPVVDQWREALEELFRKNEDRTAYIPVAQPDDPIKWSLTIGSVILAALSYSAWKMFQSDRSSVRAAKRPAGK